MAEIFISYSRDDRDTAHALAVALEGAGMPTWWDRELTGGGDFAAEIQHHLSAAPLVIVLWSHSSVQSDFVRDESSRARDQRKLLPVRIEDVALPLGFGTLHTLDLLDWDGDTDDEALIELLNQVRDRLKQAEQSAPGGRGSPPSGLRRRRASTVDPLTRRRIRRRWLIGLAAAGIAVAGGIGWSVVIESRRERERQFEQQRKTAALVHLNNALGHHEADPPDLKKAELEYRLAAEKDPTLAEAFFYWGHLTIALIERKQPKPSPAELAGLREDALERFNQALELDSLSRGKRAVVEEQLIWLAAIEPEPLDRSTDTQLVAALATAPESEALLVVPADQARPPSRPELAVGAKTEQKAKPQPPKLLGSVGSLFGKSGGSGSQSIVTKPPPPPRPAAARPSPPPPPPPRDPRLPPDPELAKRAAAEAKALFVADRDRRIGARSLLAGNPQLAADALPAALDAANAALGTAAPGGGDRAGLAATVQLVANATPAVVQANRQAIETLQRRFDQHPDQAPTDAKATLGSALQRADGKRPAVFVQIANARQKPLALKLQARFEAAGYATADIEMVGEQRSPSRPEIRSHGGSEPGMARWCLAKLAEVIGADPVLNNLRDIRPDNDVFEIWFDAALCAPGGRDMPGCAAP